MSRQQFWSQAMRALLRPVIATGILLMSLPVRAEVQVNFIRPERYSDANPSRDFPIKADSAVLRILDSSLQELGARYLPPALNLRIEVLDLDLAGRYEPWRLDGRDVRIMRDVDPPRISLRYTLERAGQPPLMREETVTDMVYLSRPEVRFHNGDPMAIEKAVLADWFRRRFAPA
jgi:hypothetical protein